MGFNRVKATINQMIKIDYREKPSGITALFEKNRIPHKIERLKFADYIIDDRVAIERKTAEDFVISLINGRLFKQVINLIKNSDYTCLIIEGNPFNTDYDIRTEAVEGALIDIEICLRTPVMFTKDVEDTFLRLTKIRKHWEKRHTGIVKRDGYKPKNIKSQQLFILQGFPHIGRTLSHRLLTHFGTLSRIFLATKEDLCEVKGINVKTARDIHLILRTFYRKQ
ncbi:hypothetical protein JW877_08295 [bacterium]|nr:hypothetical protein [bacterium]